MNNSSAQLTAFCTIGYALFQAGRVLDTSSGPYSGHDFVLWGLFAGACVCLAIR